MFPDEVKVNKNITLKVPEYSDYNELFDLTNNSRVYLKEWLPWVDNITKSEDSLNFIKTCKEEYLKRNSLTTIIRYKNKIVGIIGFNNIDWHNKTCSVGYWLGHEYQGKGIMIISVNCLVDFAFSNLALNKIEIRVAVDNKKSRVIPEKLNFKTEGYIRESEWLYDHYVDHVFYGRLKND